MRKVNISKIFTLLSICSLITVFVGCSGKVTENVPSTSIPSQPPKVQEYFIEVNGNRPFGLAFDNLGAMYMVTGPSSGNGTLSKVYPNGTVKELATLEGSFVSSGIDVDGEGNAYITLGDKLLKASPEGKISVVADGFSRCFDVKIGSNNNLFVADDLVDTIYLVSPSGEKSVYYKGEKSGKYILTSLIFDKNNNFLYAREDNRILSFDTSQNTKNAKPVLVADKLDMTHICMDNQNNIYLISANTGNIQKLDKSGNVTNIATLSLLTPIGIAPGGKGFDKDCLYVCVQNGIVKIPLLN